MARYKPGDSHLSKLLPLTFSEQRSKAIQDPPMTLRSNRRIATRLALTPPRPREPISRRSQSSAQRGAGADAGTGVTTALPGSAPAGTSSASMSARSSAASRPAWRFRFSTLSR